MLTVVTWLWGKKYALDYVKRLAASVRRNLKEKHQFLLCTDDLYRKGLNALPESIRICPIIRDLHLLDIKGCFARLRMFDPEWQRDRDLSPGDRIVCMDLDSVITGSLDALFCRPTQFSILQGANAQNPCPYNGSIWMLRAGYRPDVWTDFSLEAASKVPYFEFPDDQAWFAHKLPGAPGWMVGARSGIYAFKKPGWPKGNDLPKDARMVVFPGWRDPSKFAGLDWIKDNWRDD